jgi:hypothetical protein
LIQNQLVQLPAQPALPAGPRPANIVFPFTTPWMFGLTPATSSLPPPQDLLVETPHPLATEAGADRLDEPRRLLVGPDVVRQPRSSSACAVPGQPAIV